MFKEIMSLHLNALNIQSLCNLKRLKCPTNLVANSIASEYTKSDHRDTNHQTCPRSLLSTKGTNLENLAGEKPLAVM